MTWAATRAALIAVLDDVTEIDHVLVAPPWAGAELRQGMTAILTPPARTSDRQPSCTTEHTYRQQCTVMTLLNIRDVEPATRLVDAAVEAIDTEMELHVTLGGTATSCGPFAWEQAIATDYSPGSGVWFVSMTGTAEIIRIVDVDRRA